MNSIVPFCAVVISLLMKCRNTADFSQGVEVFADCRIAELTASDPLCFRVGDLIKISRAWVGLITAGQPQDTTEQPPDNSKNHPEPQM